MKNIAMALAIALVLLVLYGIGYWAEHLKPDQCHIVDANAVDADALMAGGWYSDPTDGAERLYSPACRH